METAALLSLRFKSLIDSLDHALALTCPDIDRRRESHFHVLMARAAEVAASEGTDVVGIFTPLSLALSSACVLVAFRPQAQQWIGATRAVLATESQLQDARLVSSVAPGDPPTVFLEQVSVHWQNWTRFLETFEAWFPSATPFERGVRDWGFLEQHLTRDRVATDGLPEVAREEIALRDRELPLFIAVGMRLLVAVALEAVRQGRAPTIADPAIRDFCLAVGPLAKYLRDTE